MTSFQNQDIHPEVYISNFVILTVQQTVAKVCEMTSFLRHEVGMRR